MMSNQHYNYHLLYTIFIVRCHRIVNVSKIPALIKHLQLYRNGKYIIALTIFSY